MPHLALIFICFLLLLTAPSEAGVAVSWNMEYFPSRSKGDQDLARQRMAQAREFLKGIAPDILLLQEVNNWEAVMEVVEPLAGFQVHSVTAFKGSRQQMAIASRWVLDSAWYEEFQIPPGVERPPPRGFAFAALQDPSGGHLLAYSVHFKSNRGEAEKNIKAREEAARQIVGHINRMRAIYASKAPVRILVGGDFNTLQDDPAFALERTNELMREAGLQWCWEGVPRESRTTWPARDGFKDATFDHFFFSGLGPSRVRLAPHSPVSDHTPVILEW